jgi:receptor protein-tyrosine kinase
MASAPWNRRRNGSGRAQPRRQERTSFEESLRVLRSNLGVMLLDLERPLVIFTSPNPNEGKTSMCSNLAMSFASTGMRVVLVDLDLRHPDAHRLVGGHNEFGLSDVLLSRRTLDKSMQYIQLPTPQGQAARGLYFLATGAAVANPTELLSSARALQLLEGLSKQADLVLLDTPPVLPVADALVIGRVAAGAVLVTESRRTSIASVNKAKDLLTRNQTRLLGVVLNKYEQRDARTNYGYGYGYGYGHATEQDNHGPHAAPPPTSTAPPSPSRAGSTHALSPNGIPATRRAARARSR